MRVVRLDHVQLAMPAGREAEAVAFYEGILGIAQVPKPDHLATRGGCWFEDGDLKVHLGVDPDFRPAISAADVDIVEARFVDIVTNDRVLQTVDFVSDDPVYGGTMTMTMTWVVRRTDGGTLVEFVADDVPAGISAEDHSAG